ncbi:MAG: OCRE domain-containing protein, partial [Aureispira sp.]
TPTAEGEETAAGESAADSVEADQAIKDLDGQEGSLVEQLSNPNITAEEETALQQELDKIRSEKQSIETLKEENTTAADLVGGTAPQEGEETGTDGAGSIPEGYDLDEETGYYVNASGQYYNADDGTYYDPTIDDWVDEPASDELRAEQIRVRDFIGFQISSLETKKSQYSDDVQSDNFLDGDPVTNVQECEDDILELQRLEQVVMTSNDPTVEEDQAAAILVKHNVESKVPTVEDLVPEGMLLNEENGYYYHPITGELYDRVTRKYLNPDTGNWTDESTVDPLKIEKDAAKEFLRLQIYGVQQRQTHAVGAFKTRCATAIQNLQNLSNDVDAAEDVATIEQTKADARTIIASVDTEEQVAQSPERDRVRGLILDAYWPLNNQRVALQDSNHADFAVIDQAATDIWALYETIETSIDPSVEEAELNTIITSLGDKAEGMSLGEAFNTRHLSILENFVNYHGSSFSYTIFSFESQSLSFPLGGVVSVTGKIGGDLIAGAGLSLDTQNKEVSVFGEITGSIAVSVSLELSIDVPILGTFGFSAGLELDCSATMGLDGYLALVGSTELRLDIAPSAVLAADVNLLFTIMLGNLIKEDWIEGMISWLEALDNRITVSGNEVRFNLMRLNVLTATAPGLTASLYLTNKSLNNVSVSGGWSYQVHPDVSNAVEQVKQGIKNKVDSLFKSIGEAVMAVGKATTIYNGDMEDYLDEFDPTGFY